MKILCVLYDDSKDGMPKNYPLSELPELKKYSDAMTLVQEKYWNASLMMYQLEPNT